MIILIATFGLTRVFDNLSQIGLATIPSWLAVSVLYFVPLALILAEFSSDDGEARGGIYSYMKRGLGPTWAFIATWSYFVANLVALQSVFSMLPIRISLALTGRDVFETRTWMLPLLGGAICLVLTWLATRGVRRFSIVADWLGKAYLLLVAALILVPLGLWLLGGTSATHLTAGRMVPHLDLDYFSTFSWLLLAVTGAEVAAPYVHDTDNPQRTFPRAILVTTLIIAVAYTLSSLAVVILMPVETVTKATGMYDVWLPWAHRVGLPGLLVARTTIIVFTLTMLTAFVIWMESPIRVMFADVPEGTFPERLTRADDKGTLHFALWAQAGVIVVLVLVPLLSVLAGLHGSEAFIRLLNDLTALAVIVPYIFLAIAYARARRKGMDAPFKMARSLPMALTIAGLVLVVSCAGYFGAGLHALRADPIDWLYVATVYGGPLLLIGLGLVLRSWSLRAHAAGTG